MTVQYYPIYSSQRFVFDTTFSFYLLATKAIELGASFHQKIESHAEFRTKYIPRIGKYRIYSSKGLLSRPRNVFESIFFNSTVKVYLSLEFLPKKYF